MNVPVRTTRLYSTFRHFLPAESIRNRFLEYYTSENDHTYISSSPVLSHFDYSVPFIESGARPFKKVFIGEEIFNYDKAVNSQKCIRLEGEHEGLNTFGVDPFRHLFFEMLGSRSFGSYNKKEACKLTWNLLTSEPFSIPSAELFVTYFSGDEQLNLPADEEVRDIWLELGLPPDRILPCDSLYNFWQLDSTGPCGSSSKIFSLRTENLHSPVVTELWNIGFVNYNRTENALESLPREIISTGMGLERLVSVLQRKDSSYHTDLFEPLFAIIQKTTGAPEYKGTFNESNLDPLYRRLVDFSRMITVSIADNTFPEMNSHLKRVLRKALAITRSEFKQKHPDHLLIELSKYVAESLHDVFPNVTKHLNQVEIVVKQEEDMIKELMNREGEWWKNAQQTYPILQSLSLNDYPDLPVTFKEFAKTVDTKTTTTFPIKRVHSLCEKHGMDRSVMDKIATALNRKINWAEYESYLNKIQHCSIKSKQKFTPTEEFLFSMKIKTDNSFKHTFFKDEDIMPAYTFPDIRARLLVILEKDSVVSIAVEPDRLPDDLKKIANAEVKLNNQEVGLIFDRTNFVAEGGGDSYDTGVIVLDENCSFIVNKTKKSRNYIIHYATPQNKCENCINVKVGMEFTLKIDPERRLITMRHNTLSHIMLAAIKSLSPYAHMKNLFVNLDFIRMKIDMLQKDIDLDKFGEDLESKIRHIVQKNYTVVAETFESSFDLLKADHVELQPRLRYPCSNIRLITFQDVSGNALYCGEPCDSVHLANTIDIGNVCVCKVENIRDVTITAITGYNPGKAFKLEDYVENQLHSLVKEIKAIHEDSTTLTELLDFSEKVNLVLFQLHTHHHHTPYLFTRSTSAHYAKLLETKRVAYDKIASAPRELMVEYLRSKIEETKEGEFAVLFCTLNIPFFRDLSYLVDVLYNNNFPSIVYCYVRGKVKGLCHVPEECIREDFNAGIWTTSIISNLEEDFEIQAEEEYNIYCYMKGKMVPNYEVIDYIELLTRLGKSAGTELMQKSSKKITQKQ